METSPDKTSRRSGHARSGPLLRTRDVEAAPPRHRAPVGTSREGTRVRPGRSRRVPMVAGAAGVLALLVGGVALVLDGDETRPSASAARPSASAAASPPAATTPPTQTALSNAVLAATAADRTPADARTALEEQLAARADGNLVLLRSAWQGDATGSARGERAVAASSTGLSAVVTAWWDAALATRISAGLDAQSAASRDYAAAVASGDVATADRARTRMAEASRELGTVLDSVTDGRIAAYVPPQDAAQYRAFVDALEDGDDAAADDAAAWLRGRLAREGAALASGVAGGGTS